ncbi:MAG: 3-hydroxyacyl-CoA dehydrogenase family protein [Bacteroidota bacterium]
MKKQVKSKRSKGKSVESQDTVDNVKVKNQKPTVETVTPTTLETAPKKAKPVEVKHLLCLLGDESLVKEYSTVFQEQGISVLELKNLNTLKTSAKKITTALELTVVSGDNKRKNLDALNNALPENVPIITSTLTETLLSQTQSLQHRHRFVGIAAFPTLISNHLVELAPSLYTTKEILDSVITLFSAAKKETATVQDSVGMVMPRILCQIINEGLFTVQNDVASPNDIDEAMKHGTNYPHGPIAWGELIGFSTVAAVLDALYHNHHEERYRVAPLLRQMAIAGVFWKEKN